MIFWAVLVARRCLITHIATDLIAAPVDIIKLHHLTAREWSTNTGCIVMVEGDVVCTIASVEAARHIIKRVVVNGDVVRIFDSDAVTILRWTTRTDLVVVDMHIRHPRSIDTRTIWVGNAKTSDRLTGRKGNRTGGGERGDRWPDSCGRGRGCGRRSRRAGGWCYVAVGLGVGIYGAQKDGLGSICARTSTAGSKQYN